jgi:Flp pilus assembly protein TadG
MIAQKRPGEKGSSLIEFTLVGIPLILLIITIIEMCLAMWSYHTLAFAVREGARYASTKGQGCTYTGNTCSTNIGAIAQQIALAGIGLAPGQMNVTFTASNGSTVTCTPLNSCYTNTTVWPPSGANTAGSSITIAGTYSVQSPLLFLYMPFTRSLTFRSFTLPATTQQIILF